MGQFGMGQPVRRIEDRRFLTGYGRYTEDIDLPHQAYAQFVRSPHAHARIVSVDCAAARAAEGVLAVYTVADLADLGRIPCPSAVKNRDGSASFVPPHPCLAEGRVRHVGDSVAMVVATSLALAKDAADLVAVEYAMLPSATDTAGALAPGQPLVWDEAPGNLAFDWAMGDEAGTDAALARAAHVTELEIVNNRIIVNSMETRNALGAYDKGTGRYTLYTASQGSHSLRKVLAGALLDVPESRIQVITPDVGGGFGMKLFMYVEYPLVLWAAKRLGRPVKWSGERSDAFMTDTHGRDNVTKVRLGLDADGRFLGMKVETKANLGAYLSLYGPFVATAAGACMLPGVYATPSIWVNVKGVFTNTVWVDAYRGAGRPEASYLVERLVDKAAAEIGLAPAELRRRNFIRPDQMPFRTALGITYDSGDFARNMDDALAIIDADGFEQRRAAAATRGTLRGLGIATYVEQCGGGADEMAELRFDPSGGVSLLVGSQASGQGHQTAYAQLAADALGLDIADIEVHQGDSDRVSFGRGTGGSRSLPVGGVAVTRAVDKIIQKGRTIAAHLMEAAEADIDFADGRYTIAGTDRTLGIVDVAKAAFTPGKLPPGLEPGFAEKAHFTPIAATYPNGAHVCELEIDRDTGTIAIQRYVVVDDFGAVVNPLMLAGQVHGGVVQGLGQALYERVVFDPASGQLLSGSFMDYCLPRADNVPEIEFSVNVVPCTTNPLGVKGAGEAGAIGAPPAVVNALLNALAPLGIGHVDMPVTAERLWELISAATAERQAA